MYAYPWRRPGLLQQHEGPDKWQRDFLLELGRQVKERRFDGTQPVAPIRMCVVSGHGVGKSVLCAWITHWIMSTRPRARGTITANTYSQLSKQDLGGCFIVGEASDQQELVLRDWRQPVLPRHERIMGGIGTKLQRGKLRSIRRPARSRFNQLLLL